MGGLKKYLPITYWTFVIGSLALAGFPLLAGFFSKDELLFETFAEGHTILWAIGALTSLLTAIYMGRLVFLTFHGERRHDAPAAAGCPRRPLAAIAAHDAHGHGGGHGHGAHHGAPHDAPPAMALALVVLAIGSVLAGYVGVPAALGGHNGLGAWLAPSFAPPVRRRRRRRARRPPRPRAPARPKRTTRSTSRSSGRSWACRARIAIGGLLVAAFIWLQRREIAANMARSFAPIHRLLLNKYYVDELYDATIVQPVQAVSREGLWRGVDVGVIDGAVNGVGAIVDASAGVLRRLQTGSVRAYAGSLFIGVVLMLGYYLWR